MRSLKQSSEMFESGKFGFFARLFGLLAKKKIPAIMEHVHFVRQLQNQRLLLKIERKKESIDLLMNDYANDSER